MSNTQIKISRHKYTGKHRLGNKAQVLLELSKKGIIVPPSLFLDASVYENFYEQQVLPPNLINGFLQETDTQELFVVRSSSSLEDSQHQSFAGYFKSILNISNHPVEIEKNIIQCYQEFMLHEAHIKKKINHSTEVYLGLIIQPMIISCYSGVIFTCPPNNPNLNYFQIEYVEGCNEQMTGANQTGNVVTIDKITGKIVGQSGDLLLSKNLLIKLLELARRFDAMYPMPQDIEFAIREDNQEIVVLQSRPITAFHYTPDFIIQKETKKIRQIFDACKQTYSLEPVLSSYNIAELFPEANPMGYSIFKTIFAGNDKSEGAVSRGRRVFGYAPLEKNEQKNLWITIGNQARVNLLIDALTFRLAGIDRKDYLKTMVTRYLDEMRQDGKSAHYPEFGTYQQNPNPVLCNELFGEDGERIHTVFNQFLRQFFDDNTVAGFHRLIRTFLKKNKSFYIKEKTIMTESSSLNSEFLFQKLSEYMAYAQAEMGTIYVVVGRLDYLSQFMLKDLFLSIQKGCKCPEPEVETLVDEIISITGQELVYPKEYKTPDSSKAMERLRRNEIDRKSFMDKFGHVGSLDVSQPRWIEMNSEVFERQFNNTVKNKTAVDRKYKFFDWFERMSRDEPELWSEIRKWAKLAAAFMPLRERMKFELYKITYLIKLAVSKLAEIYHLNQNIFFLTFDQLFQLKEKPNELALSAKLNRAYFESCSKICVNRIISSVSTENIFVPKKNINEQDDSYKIIHGETIYSGEAQGYSLIARTGEEFCEKMLAFHEKGIYDIIGFFKGLELSYIDLPKLKGFVTVEGGFLSHAATIARENNIPYITNVSMDGLSDGCLVIMDTYQHQIIFKK